MHEATIQEQGASQLCPDHHGPLAPNGLPPADSAEVTASLRTAATALGGSLHWKSEHSQRTDDGRTQGLNKKIC